MSIYTRTGDQGQTSLASGERVAKTHVRIEAYGTIDELNSALGICRAQLPDGVQDWQARLENIQQQLFSIGSWLAMEPGQTRDDRMPMRDRADAGELEKLIDECNDQIPPFRAFILPGGHPAAAQCHLARTICRRAERRILALQGTLEPDETDVQLLRYINRLSDLLFVLARLINLRTGTSEPLWSR